MPGSRYKRQNDILFKFRDKSGLLLLPIILKRISKIWTMLLGGAILYIYIKKTSERTKYLNKIYKTEELPLHISVRNYMIQKHVDTLEKYFA